MADPQKTSIKAIALGILADIGASTVAGLALGMVVGFVLASRGVPMSQIKAELLRPVVLIPSVLIGCASTVLGGYVAGRVAKTAEIKHGGAVGVLGLLLGLVFAGSYPIWYIVCALVVAIPAGMLGGRIAMVARRGPSEGPGSDAGHESVGPGGAA